MTYSLRFIVVAVAALTLMGCSNVKPWEKGTLAKNEMAFTPDPLETKLGDHIYFAKEATGSGAEVSGGGCGCN